MVGDKYYVGTLCNQGHRYQGRDRSLRYLSGNCVECKSIRDKANWEKKRSDRPKRSRKNQKLIIPLDDVSYLTTLCKRGHKYEDQDLSRYYYSGNYCVECNKHQSYGTEASKQTRRAYYETHREDFKRRNRDDYEKHSDRYIAAMNKRRAAKKQAVASWGNPQAIREFYKKAALLSKQSDIKHHVDHCDPLQHDLVCGLHIETNLQILTEAENLAKSNSFTPYRVNSLGEQIYL